MRKNKPTKRQLSPDPLFNSILVTRLINIIMYEGKKGLAQQIVYGAFEKVTEKSGKPALDLYKAALNNIMPVVELKVRRVGGANYQIPVEVSEERKIALALRWLITYARLRKEKTMIDKLANEILDAASNTGAAVKKKEDTHRMAEANKAFSHMRF